MKRSVLVVSIFLLVFGCKTEKDSQELKEGVWRAHLNVMDNQQLPFNFKLLKTTNGDYEMEIRNAAEIIVVDEITVNGDSI